MIRKNIKPKKISKNIKKVVSTFSESVKDQITEIRDFKKQFVCT